MKSKSEDLWGIKLPDGEEIEFYTWDKHSKTGNGKVTLKGVKGKTIAIKKELDIKLSELQKKFNEK